MFGILVRNYVAGQGRYNPIKDEEEENFPPLPTKKYIGSGEDFPPAEFETKKEEGEIVC